MPTFRFCYSYVSLACVALCVRPSYGWQQHATTVARGSSADGSSLLARSRVPSALTSLSLATVRAKEPRTRRAARRRAKSRARPRWRSRARHQRTSARRAGRGRRGRRPRCPRRRRRPAARRAADGLEVGGEVGSAPSRGRHGRATGRCREAAVGERAHKGLAGVVGGEGGEEHAERGRRRPCS